MDQFDHTQGSAFVREGYLYYSPNCRRRIVINPRPDVNPNPFAHARLNVSHFRQPVWWTEPWGWMSFIPLAPTFLSYPFQPFIWVPKIDALRFPIDGPPFSPPHFVTKFQMAADDLQIWTQKESLLVEAARNLHLYHGIVANPPPPPSFFGYTKLHKTQAIAKCMISLLRDWFAIWMGYLAYIIRQVEVSSRRPPDPNSPHPRWYQRLLDDDQNRWSLPWLDGVTSSPVCTFDRTMARAGIVIVLSERDYRLPPIGFFLKCNVPLFFPWTLTAEKMISADRSLAYLRPPKELIQEALTFILSAPQSAPLAFLVMRRFYGPTTKIANIDTVHALRLQHSTSEVVKLVTKAFLDQYQSLDQVEADAILKREIDQYHDNQARQAAEDAMLPQQGMMTPLENAGQHSVFNDWKDFFRKRHSRRADILKGASPKDLQRFNSRRARPPIKNTRVFVWEHTVAPGGTGVFIRKSITKSENEDCLLDEDRPPSVYDEVHDEWDVFPDFITDTNSTPEQGVPPVCLAPPRKYVPFDTDSDGEEDAGAVSPSANQYTEPPSPYLVSSTARKDVPFDYYADDDDDDYEESPPLASPYRAPPSLLPEPSTVESSSRRPASLPPLPADDEHPRGATVLASPYTRPSPPRSEQLAVEPSSVPTAAPLSPRTNSPDSEVAEEEDISSSTPLMQTLMYNYGFTPTVPTASNTVPSLDWRGVEKMLGYGASLPRDQEDLNIRIFLSLLAEKNLKALPAEMDDLHPDNFTSLRNLFDFRNIMRVEENLFVFYSIPSSGYPWQLGVLSTEAVLYVVRYLVANPGLNLGTIVHRLLKFGIPFHTLRCCRSNLPSLRIPIEPRYRFPNHIFTAADFDSAMLACRSLLQGPAGRAALMRGGIMGRIAREYISFDPVLDGPSESTVQQYPGLAINAETEGYQYLDDALTENDIAVICGSYAVFTGYGSQQTYVSYFPLPRDWDDKNGFCWLEWTNASEALFQSILAANRAGEQPRKAKKWRVDLRGFGSTRRLMDSNHVRSASFIQEFCRVRHRQ